MSRIVGNNSGDSPCVKSGFHNRVDRRPYSEPILREWIKRPVSECRKNIGGRRPLACNATKRSWGSKARPESIASAIVRTVDVVNSIACESRFPKASSTSRNRLAARSDWPPKAK